MGRGRALRRRAWASHPEAKEPVSLTDHYRAVCLGSLVLLAAATHAQTSDDGRRAADAQPPAETGPAPAGDRHPAPPTETAAASASEQARPAATPVSDDAVATPAADLLHEGLSWDYCGPRPAKLGRAVLPPQPAKDDPVYIDADDFVYDQGGDLLTLTGAIELAQGTRQLRADRMTYKVDSEEVAATGNVFFAHPGVRLIGSGAQMNLETDRGTIRDTGYRLTGPMNARGTADQADLLGKTLTHYENITYTTCRPGQEDWSLTAAKLDIDQAEGWGIARDAKLRVRGIPVLYTPYLSFPIDDRRKSGFLIPSIGSSSETGFDLTTPYYWNIAPAMDATLSPRYMSKRGLMLGAEYRLLTERQRIELYGEVIPEDRMDPDHSPRGALRLEQSGRFGSRLSSFINLNAVSDDQYLEDFGNRLDVTSVRNIERRGDLVYAGSGWQLLTRVQGFQTVDSGLPAADQPYARLPQLLLTVTPQRLGPGIEIGVDGEYDFFDHSAKVDGQRLALQPYVSWPLRRPYGHLIPRVNLYHASYALQDQAAGDPNDPSHTLPSFNLDGKLVFERTIDWVGHSSLQTLEPRIFYLYTPYQDQDDTPVFDSTDLTFSYSSLFRLNRFTGRDRIGDANQVTLGVTSRTLATESGQELFHASVGQILYFRDRDVQIGGPAEIEPASGLAGELGAQFLPNLSGWASFQWDPSADSDPWEKRALMLHYETPEDRLINFSYRFDLGTSAATRYEDTDLTFRWPVSPQVGLVGRWFYSLLYNETMEAFAGIEYGKCCWRVRLLGRHIKNSAEGDGNTSVMLQLELAGLGTVGHKIDKFLERGIYGYHAD